MRTTAIRVILAAAVACGPCGCGPCGCGPIDVSITTGEGDGSEWTDPTTGEPVTTGSTGIGASESGEPATTTSTGSTSTGEMESSGSTSDASTSTTGSSGADRSSGGESSGTTGEPVCVVALIGGAEQCACDNVPADPSDCGCMGIGALCVCDGVIYSLSVCGGA